MSPAWQVLLDSVVYVPESPSVSPQNSFDFVKKSARLTLPVYKANRQEIAPPYPSGPFGAVWRLGYGSGYPARAVVA
jgi:hypothetical protein